MRFYDFFISYKLGLKEVNDDKTIGEILQLLRHDKFFCIVIGLLIGMICAGLFGRPLELCVLWAILIVVTLIYMHVCSAKNIMKNRLEEHWKPYSDRRMEMVVHLLEKYHIDITDEKSIDLLIEEAQQEQINRDIFSFNRGYIKVFLTALFSGIIFLIKEIIEDIEPGKLLLEFTPEQLKELLLSSAILLIMIFTILLVGDPIVAFIRALFGTDYDKYNELISDLRQVKIFYKKPTTRMTITATAGTASDDTAGAPVASGARHTCMR